MRRPPTGLGTTIPKRRNSERHRTTACGVVKHVRGSSIRTTNTIPLRCFRNGNLNLNWLPSKRLSLAFRLPPNETKSGISPIEKTLTSSDENPTSRRFTNDFTSKKRRSFGQAIRGLGGIGKTETAVAYAYKFRNEYEAVLWVRAGTVLEIEAGFVTIDQWLWPDRETQKTEDAVNNVLRWLNDNSGWLLIFDNADTPERLRAIHSHRVWWSCLAHFKSELVQKFADCQTYRTCNAGTRGCRRVPSNFNGT